MQNHAVLHAFKGVRIINHHFPFFSSSSLFLLLIIIAIYNNLHTKKILTKLNNNIK